MNRRIQGSLTMSMQDGKAVQAEAPMTATGEGALLPVRGQGVSPFFCSKIPRGSGGGAPGLGLRTGART